MHKNGCPAPNNPWGAPAGASDCDKDGIPDSIDACPDTPGVKTTEPQTNGCPNNPWGAPTGASDCDKDQVPDSIDACPDTPGVKTTELAHQRLPEQSVGRARRRCRLRWRRRPRHPRCLRDVAGVKTTDPKTHGCPAGNGAVDPAAPIPLQPALPPVVPRTQSRRSPADCGPGRSVSGPPRRLRGPAAAPPPAETVWYKPWTWFREETRSELGRVKA